MVGLNLTLVGNIKIGNNIRISLNSFVKFNVPDNSIAIGKSGVSIHGDNATNGYIINTVTCG